jgi:hypothetical protein
MLEQQEGVRVPHGLVFPLAIVAAIGGPHGLDLVAEEETADPVTAFDAVFISVLDSRCAVHIGERFIEWRMPIRSADRRPVGSWPLVWLGGSGAHNPAPFGAIADLVVIGDAEDPLPQLLALWDAHGNTERFLSAAAAIEGVWVPSVHGPSSSAPPITQAVASDITVTLRHEISVNLDNRRRIEIARGCRYNCHFCSLGWRTPLRENPAEAVVAEIRRSPKLVHLQAGDAESHSGISEIRAALREHGGFDSGWTGRLDSLLENPDQTIPGQKRYAFGVEGVSYRLRRAVGKGYLTDERLIDDTVRFFGQVEDSSVGRAAWHLIAGLPTERIIDYPALGAVVAEIDARQRANRSRKRNLSLHWQPFQPLPGTPMQWAPCGGGARRAAFILAHLRHCSHLQVRHVVGRTDQMARLCTLISRADERAVDLFDALARRRVGLDEARAITGGTWDELPVDVALPWDFIVTWRSKEFLARSWVGVQRRLMEDRHDLRSTG